MSIQILNDSLIQNIQKLHNIEKPKVNSEKLQCQNNNFQDVLNNAIESDQKLQFSKHATMRLKARNIQISDNQMQRIQTGLTKAKEKGIRDSLILVDDIALVVNTRNNIVITAMEQSKNNDNVYTNIDGTVII